MNSFTDKKPTASEREIAKELLNISLANAADSFSATIGEKVLLEKLKFNYRTKPRDFRFPKLPATEGLVLKSEIKGDIPGVSFLIFDDIAIENLGTAALPPSMRDLPESEIPGMREEMLVELDNIVTASTVSQLANHFDSFMYGAVPEKQKMSAQSVQSLLKREAINYRPNVMVSTQFYTAAMPVGPRFIWFFNYEFISAIKNLSTKKGVYALEKVPA